VAGIRDRGPALRGALEVVLLGVMPLVLTIAVVRASVGHAFATEFVGNLWQPARHILDGRPPYDPAALDRVAELVRSGRTPAGFQVAVYPTYPAPTLMLGVPLALLPLAVARWIWFVVVLACPAFALRVLGVRDWRAYGATYLSIVVISGAMLGSLTLLLLVGLALLWRWRDDPLRCALTAAAVVVGKLFLWPVVVWLWLTGRRREACGAVAAGGLACLLAWSVVGFDSLASYPHLLQTLNSIEQERGYSLVRAGIAAHLGAHVAAALAVAAGLAILAWCRRGDVRLGAAGDRRVFVLAVISAFVLSPIVWEQYYALLFVPIAVLDRRFRPLWLAPLLFWMAPFNATDGHPERLLLAGVVLACVGAAALSRRDNTSSVPAVVPLGAARMGG
jgi:hypothetical protein